MPKVRKLSQDEIRQLEAAALPLARSYGGATKPVATGLIDDAYPYIAAWVHERGWIEIGSDEYSQSFIRVLDSGGMVWEGAAHYSSVGAALRAADLALAQMEADGEL